MKSSPIHIARNGQVLGIYEADKIADQLEVGSLLPSDFYYSEDRKEWLALSEWKSPKAEFRPLSASSEKASDEDAAAERKPKRRDAKSRAAKKKKEQGSLAGWIACLFAIGAAAGLWAWAQSLNVQLEGAMERIANLDETVKVLSKQAELMGEITPPGYLRAVVTYEPQGGKIAVMSGVTVGIYRKSDIEPLIKKIASEKQGQISSVQDFDDSIENLFSLLPSPQKISLTSADGRVNIPIGDPGEYILVSSATKKTSASTERLLWMVGFRNDGNPSQILLLNENNAITAKKPQFSVRDLDRMDTAGASSSPVKTPAFNLQDPVSPSEPAVPSIEAPAP